MARPADGVDWQDSLVDPAQMPLAHDPASWLAFMEAATTPEERTTGLVAILQGTTTALAQGSYLRNGTVVQIPLPDHFANAGLAATLRRKEIWDSFEGAGASDAHPYNSLSVHLVQGNALEQALGLQVQPNARVGLHAICKADPGAHWDSTDSLLGQEVFRASGLLDHITRVRPQAARGITSPPPTVPLCNGDVMAAPQVAFLRRGRQHGYAFLPQPTSLAVLITSFPVPRPGIGWTSCTPAIVDQLQAIVAVALAQSLTDLVMEVPGVTSHGAPPLLIGAALAQALHKWSNRGVSLRVYLVGPEEPTVDEEQRVLKQIRKNVGLAASLDPRGTQALA